MNDSATTTLHPQRMKPTFTLTHNGSILVELLSDDDKSCVNLFQQHAHTTTSVRVAAAAAATTVLHKLDEHYE
jgi:hypothetical protein